MNENEYGNNGQYGGLREQIPEGLMEHLPEGVKDRIEDVIAETDQKLSNPYERVEPDIQKTNMNTKVVIATVVIGFGGVLVFAKINPIIAVLCFGLMLVVFGIGIVADKNFSFHKNACSEQVQAVCVYIKEKREYQEKRSRTVYAPVFEFQFLGNTYCVAENYGNGLVPQIGDRCELFINPNNIKEFYRKGSNSRIGIWIFCIIFIMFGVLVFCLG